MKAEHENAASMMDLFSFALTNLQFVYTVLFLGIESSVSSVFQKIIQK